MTKTINEEIQYLGQMLTATREEDTQRLMSIGNRLHEIGGGSSNKGTTCADDEGHRVA